MKKKFVVLVSILMSALLLFGCAQPPADYSGVDFSGVNVFALDNTAELTALNGDLKEFVYGNRDIAIEQNISASANILNRTAFTRADENAAEPIGEQAAAARLKKMLGEDGYQNGDDKETPADRTKPYYLTQNFSLTRQQRNGLFQVVETEIYSQNVIVRIPSETATQGRVVLLTHYDNSYGSELLKGSQTHGVYESGIAVAAALRVTEVVLRAALPYDVEVVFLGASAPGGYGASYYASQMTTAEKSETKLVMNFDLLGGGDFDYLFCDDVETEHEEYIRAAASAAQADLSRAPRDKKVIVTGSADQVYRHAGLISDHYLFYKMGLNTAAIFGMNWNNSDTYGIYESAKHETILDTTADNLYTVAAYYPDYAERALSAVKTFLTTVTGERFAETMKASADNRPNLGYGQSTTIAACVLIGLIVLAFIAVTVIGTTHAKRHPIPVATAPPPPAPEDIFKDVSENDPFASPPPTAKDDSTGDSNEDGTQQPSPPDNDNPFEGY